MRKTKIICTLGPATSGEDKIRELMLAGMNVARFNFSHGSYDEHTELFNTVKKVAKELNLPVATLLDTKGPEIRVKSFKQGKIMLAAGQKFILTTNEVEGDENCVSITYKNLPQDISVGTVILLDDGLIELNVTKIDKNDIICTVVNGGPLSNNKGVNVPDVSLSMPYISEKDKNDIIFGVKTGFDFIAASFARSADDIIQVRQILDSQNCHSIKIIAKIENAEGVSNIDDILRVSDGIMIARGDMGVEIPFEEVPVLQKKLIKKAYNCGKLVITATQMLDSMMKNPRPTRAEATDVANAIYDGTSAIMLSGETAAGAYPIESVKTMSLIAKRAEKDIDYKKRFYRRDNVSAPDVTNAISHATVTTAYDLGAAAIITVTQSGQTARMISKYRPEMQIIGCTSVETTYRQINMSWGVTPLMIEQQSNSDDLFAHAVESAKNAGLVKNGDLVVITAGVPVGISGTTNLIKVHIVGDVLVSGYGINKLSTRGNLCVARNEAEALANFKQNDILVIPQTSNNLLSLLKKASAVITEQKGLNSHAAIVGLALDIPVIIGAERATEILKSGTNVLVDCERGIVCNTSK